jgi:putative FmdB family regulatory protein
MPVYEFTCPQCGVYDERYIRLADLEAQKDKQLCPNCEALMVKKFSIPILKTDTAFMAGSHIDDGLPDDASRKIAYAKARAAGVNVSGKRFQPGLCPTGDMFSPKAWCGDRAEIKRKAEELGRDVDGAVTHRSSIRDEHYAKLEKPYRVAPHVVMPYVEKEIKEVHGGKVDAKTKRDIIEKHRDRHSGSPRPAGNVKLFGK